MAHRLLRRYLSGRLEEPVSAYPAFPGNEANYLRTLIARIGSATVCCPRGYFLADEDSAELSQNDEWEPLKGREMALPVNWSHRYAHIKVQGRTVAYKRDPPDEEEEPEKVRGWLGGRRKEAHRAGPGFAKLTSRRVAGRDGDAGARSRGAFVGRRSAQPPPTQPTAFACAAEFLDA